ncbi:hypothetical protein AVEN_177606-1 [Araneus ventricosus]|uniref:SOCS box domain-containing protein n=1 Tax=Araneus ventricosus TaxID=182803 RepID=A0A4Y2EK94_ARAVE|nr:hypothetical protein AVEN_177606-1 [Araneus ventricosus]
MLRSTQMAWSGFHFSAHSFRIYAFDSCLAHYLLERCFWIRYGDNKVVTHLLTILFELDGHLGKVFDFRMLPVGSRSWQLKLCELEAGRDCSCIGFPEDNFVVGSTWKNELLAAEIIKPVDYFIEHAYKSRILFDNKRFAEQFIIHCVRRTPGRQSSHLLCQPPCAMSFTFPEILPKLLEHGLFVTASPKDENVGKLLTGILGMYASSRFETIPHEIQEMGNILLRAVKSVDSSVLMKCQRIRNRSHSVEDVLAKVIEMDVLPKLEKRCSGPQELQHICRCSIRKSLYDSWQLPNGICFLPLPTRLKNYINLKLD